MDYYCSPIPTDQGASAPVPALPTGVGRPRRRGRGLAALITFSAVILILAAALVALRFLLPEGWLPSLEGLIPWTEHSFSFAFEGPEDFPNVPEIAPDSFNDQWVQSESPTSIPRAELNPGVQMLLSALPREELSFQEIYEKVIPSIVSVYAYGSSGGGEGTGVVMTADGYVVTNHHIIAGCAQAEVALSDGTWYEARLVGSDVESDLAVLKIEAQGLSPAEFGRSEALRVGDVVLAIGNPLGAELFGTMTEGIVSAINRDVNVDGYTMSLIQTTAALNRGNSGGALVNTAGQVVGITNLKMMSDYDTIEGLGFAIPTAWAKEVVDVLLAQGAVTGRPTIGITCLTIPEGGEATYGRETGVYVDAVTANGPAAQAGLRPGDVIIAANGMDVATLEELTVARDAAGVGGSLALTVWRDGEILELTLILADQHELQ